MLQPDPGLTMPKLYDELAEWWPLMSSPAEYAEEAAFYARHLTDGAVRVEHGRHEVFVGCRVS